MAKKRAKKREPDETIGSRLQRLRRAKGVTQTELATKLGTIQAVISDYERGKLRLHGQVIIDIARALGVSSDELLGLKSTEDSSTVHDRRLLRRLDRIQQLSQRDQQALIRTIDAFLTKAS